MLQSLDCVLYCHNSIRCRREFTLEWERQYVWWTILVVTSHGLSRHGTTWHDTARPITTRHDPSRPSTTRHDLARPGTTLHGPSRHDTARPCMTQHNLLQPGTARYLQELRIDISEINYLWKINQFASSSLPPAVNHFFSRHSIRRRTLICSEIYEHEPAISRDIVIAACLQHACAKRSSCNILDPGCNGIMW